MRGSNMPECHLPVPAWLVVKVDLYRYLPSPPPLSQYLYAAHGLFTVAMLQHVFLFTCLTCAPAIYHHAALHTTTAFTFPTLLFLLHTDIAWWQTGPTTALLHAFVVLCLLCAPLVWDFPTLLYTPITCTFPYPIPRWCMVWFPGHDLHTFWGSVLVYSRVVASLPFVFCHSACYYLIYTVAATHPPNLLILLLLPPPAPAYLSNVRWHIVHTHLYYNKLLAFIHSIHFAFLATTRFLHYTTQVCARAAAARSYSNCNTTPY